MLRFLAAFIVLFAGAAAVIAVLPNAPKLAPTPAAVAAPRDEVAQPEVDRAAVRVVYPASGNAASPVTAAAQPTTPPIVPAAAPVAQTATVASLDPQPAASPALADATSAASQTASQTININTASIDALNQIPGAGHIGRSIASHRPYRSVEDLLTKRVVRKAVYDRIKAQVAAN